MGDGNLDPKFTSRFIGKPDDLELLKNLIIKRFYLSQNQFKIYKRINKGISHLLQVNFASFGRILFILGAPIGNKTINDFCVPPWIMNHQNNKKRFLQALLEDELTTIKIQKSNYSIKPRLKMSKKIAYISHLNTFMNQVKNAIESFGVECSNVSPPVKGKNPESLELYFHINRNKRNIIKFKENIGFRFNQDKIKQLIECCRVLKNTLK